MSTPVRFSDDFTFGAATAAYQVEGAISEDGRTDSIWDVFCREPGRILNFEDGSIACDHYHRMPADVALMAELGLQTYRFSVSWPRAFAEGRVNPAGLDFYSRLVDELLEHQITPWLTLYHWDLPAALPGGWTNRDTVDRFVEYALAVHDRLGDRVRTWTTLNEPWCSAFLGYAAGVHAPGHTDPGESLRAAHHLLLAHGRTVRALREIDPKAQLGITLNFTPVVPASDSAADQDAARRVDGTANRLFADAIFTGRYPTDVVADLAGLWPEEVVADGDMEIIAAPLDVLGVNYYTTQAIAAGPDVPITASANVSAPQAIEVSRGLPRTAMGWEIDPDGLYRLLMRLHQDYTAAATVPMVITENGAAFEDQPDASGYVDDNADRIEYLREHLRAVHRARAEGADVRGYLVWSLMDNFEWALGYSKRFGVVRIDEDLRRIPKASARWYSTVIDSREV